MHVANRSQMITGVSALAVGALFTAPALLSQQHVEAPVAQAPVALSSPIGLSAAVSPIAGLITAGQQAAGGVIGSGAQANVIYPSDAIFIGGSLVTQVQGLIAHPSTIPAAIVGLPGQVEGLTELVENQSTGVKADGELGQITIPFPTSTSPLITVDAYSLPGEFVPATTNPGAAGFPGPNATTVNNSATNGFRAAAGTLDSITPAGLPKLATPITVGAQEVGTSLIQAGGLVRSASATAVQNTFNAVASGNPTNVRNAVVGGVSGVSKSVFGDSSVPLVTPISSSVGVDLPSGGVPVPGTVAPVKRLGAIGTVTTTVTKAVTGVATAATH